MLGTFELADIREISSLFNSSVFMSLSNGVLENKILREACTGTEKLSEVFDYYYSIMSNNYRNEYIFKNEISNKIFLKKHNIRNASLLSEVSVKNSIADLVVINGTTSVYEIKTAYDSLDRLQNQIEDYRKVFDKISIVTTSKYIDILLNDVDYIDIGLIEMDGSKIKNIRDSNSHLNTMDQVEILRLLKRNEYLTVLSRLGLKIPEVSNSHLFFECKKIFKEIPIDIVHKESTLVLKKRLDISGNQPLVEKLPYSLKLHGLTRKMSRKEIDNIKLLFD